MSVLYAVLAAVLLQRLGELAWAARNTARLRTQGGVEVDRRGYKWFVLLHGAWLASMALLPGDAVPSWRLLAVYAGLQLGRLWVIASLGERWTTRIIVLPGGRLVRRGPYRYVRHPNYAIAAAEIAVLPLAFGAATIAGVLAGQPAAGRPPHRDRGPGVGAIPRRVNASRVRRPPLARSCGTSLLG